MWKIYSELTKFGIVIFVVLSGIAGFAASYQIEQNFNPIFFFKFVAGLYFLSSGSLAWNQVQEWKSDQLMKRTKNRPIASGKIKPAAGAILVAVFLLVGSTCLFQVSSISGWLGVLTVVLYNVFYTPIWKRRWAFAAVPGAIPGALPITIGFALNDPHIFKTESVYLFLIMFLWQMPHFWTLAIKHKDDYAAGGVPTLPVSIGVERTLYHIGLYTFVYVACAMASPWLTHAHWLYLLVVTPLSFQVLREFFRFFKSGGTQRWLSFFLWTNFSMLLYISVPVVDKWSFLFIHHG